MKILYFAWLRECIGISSEEYSTTATTVRDLISELIKIEPRYEKAFLNLSLVKVAIDQELADSLDDSITGAREIAFFPPMTGG
jgi:molybdopterin synthase sulfur carrier subunit